MAISIQNLFKHVAENMVRATGLEAYNYHPFLKAILAEDSELAMKILKEARHQRKIQEIVTLKTLENHTVLSLALENGMLKLAKELLSLPGIPVFEKNRDGDNALMIAIREDYKDIIVIIFGHLDLKKNLHDINNKGDDVFMIAVRKKNFELANTLLSLGANLEGRDKKGNTRLMTAISELPHECVQYLLSKGADINAKNTEGDTALIVAVKQEKKYLVRYLCEHGASVTVRDAAGKSLEEILKTKQANNDNRAIWDLVKAQPQPPKVPYNYKEIFVDALRNNNLENFKYCIYAINRDFMNLEITVETKKWKPIQIAVCLGHLAIVQFMLDEDENLANEKDTNGNNLLHIAAASGQLEVLKYLCNEGADLTAKNNHQQDAMQLARINRRDDIAKFIHNEVIVRNRNKSRESLDENVGLFDRESFIETFPARDSSNQMAQGLHLRGLALIAHYFSSKGTAFYVVENEAILRHALSLLKEVKDGTEYGLVCRLSGHAFAVKCEKYNGINSIILMDSLGNDGINAYALDALGTFNVGMYLEAILPEIFHDQPGRTCFFQNKEGRQTSGPVCSIFAVKDIRKMLMWKKLSRSLIEAGAKKMDVRVLSEKTIKSGIDRNTVTNFEYNTPDLFMRLTQSPDQFMEHVIQKRKQKIESRDKLRQSLPDDLGEQMNMLEMYNEYEAKLRDEESKEAIERLYNSNDPLDFLNKKMEFQTLSQYAMRSRNHYGVKTPEMIENRNYHPINNPNVPQFILKNKTIEYFRNKYIHIVDAMLKSCSTQQLHFMIQAFNAKHLKLIFPQNTMSHSSDKRWNLLGYQNPEGILVNPYRQDLIRQINERVAREKRLRDMSEELSTFIIKLDLQLQQQQEVGSNLQRNPGVQQAEQQNVEEQVQSSDRDEDGRPKAKKAKHI